MLTLPGHTLEIIKYYMKNEIKAKSLFKKKVCLFIEVREWVCAIQTVTAR